MVNFNIYVLIRCPSCRATFHPERDQLRLFLVTTDCESCLSKQEEIENLQLVLEAERERGLELAAPEPAPASPQPVEPVPNVVAEVINDDRLENRQDHTSLRQYVGRVSAHARCWNCESGQHTVRDCEEPPFLRLINNFI